MHSRLKANLFDGSLEIHENWKIPTWYFTELTNEPNNEIMAMLIMMMMAMVVVMTIIMAIFKSENNTVVMIVMPAGGRSRA